MNKSEFIKIYISFLKRYNLAPSDAAVGAGGIMLLLGVRSNTQDMDLSVSQKVYDMIEFDSSFTLDDGRVVGTVMDVIDIHVSNTLDSGLMIDGVWCENLETLYKLRKSLNRPKDQKEIKALEILLN